MSFTQSPIHGTCTSRMLLTGKLCVSMQKAIISPKGGLEKEETRVVNFIKNQKIKKR